MDDVRYVSSRGARRLPALAAFVTCAVVGASLAACSSGSSRPSTTARAAVKVTSPADGAISTGDALVVSATTTGNPTRVDVWVGETKLGTLNGHGSSWTAQLPIGQVLAPGKNELVVRALGTNDVLAKQTLQVWRLGSPSDFGLALSSTGTDGGTAVHVGLVHTVAHVLLTVNGQQTKSTLSNRAGSRTVDLGAGDGLHPGANTVQLTAVADGGAYQQASATVDVPTGAPVAEAGATVRGRTGIPVKLDATGSQPGSKGAALAYHWDVVRAPVGAHPVLSGADTGRPTLTTDQRGGYVVRTRVSQPGRPTTTDTVTVVSQDSSIPVVGEHLQSQLASVNGIAVDGSVAVWNDANGVHHPAQLPGGQTGVILALFDRATLDVVKVDVAAGSSAQDAQQFASDVDNAIATDSTDTAGVIAVLSSPSGAGGSAQSPNTTWEPLLQALAVDNPKAPDAWDKNVQYGNPFSSVSVLFPDGSSRPPNVWRSSHTPSPATTTPAATQGESGADISGYMELGNGGAGNYVFIPNTYVPIDTSAAVTATTNTIAVGTCSELQPLGPGGAQPSQVPGGSCVTLTSPSLALCPTSSTSGGFQVAVLWAATLEPVENQSFATNSGCAGGATDHAAITAMTALLQKYPDANGTDDHLVVVQSIGAPRPPLSESLESAWYDLAEAVHGVGGTASTLVQLGSGSGYTLVGADDLTRPGVEKPFGVATSGDAPALHPNARIAAMLGRNRRNDLAPTTTSTGGPLGDGIMPILYARPTPWPVPCQPAACPSGSSTEGQQNALDFVTNYTAAGFHPDLSPNQGDDGLCFQPSHPSIRNSYCNTGITSSDWDNWASFLCAPQSTPPCKPLAAPKPLAGHPFTRTDWTAVVTQLAQEATDVAATLTFVTRMTSAINFVVSYLNSRALTNKETQLLTALKLSAQQRNPVKSVSFWLDIVSAVAGIVWAVAGAFDPAVYPVARFIAAGGGVVSELAGGIGSTLDTVGVGVGGANTLEGEVKDAAQELRADAYTLYSSAAQNVGWVGEIVSTDWGKLQAFAQLPTGDWTNKNEIEDSMKTSAVGWLYPQMLSAAFQPDALQRWTFSGGCDSPKSCEALYNDHVPYSGDASNFSCVDGAGLSPENYFPFAPAADGQYLAFPTGGPPSRYVLTAMPPWQQQSTPGNPTDFYGPGKTFPPQPVYTPPGQKTPVNLVTPMVTPVAGYGDTEHLGIAKDHLYEDILGLSSGTPATCFVHAVAFPYTLATAANSAGSARNLYYVDRGSQNVTNIYRQQNGRWNGPGPMPGKSAGRSQLAAAGDSVFFIDGSGKVQVDSYSPNGWQGPTTIPTPGKLDGGQLAASTGGPTDTNVFFSSGGISNAWYDGTWHCCGPLAGSPDKDSSFAAVEDVPGQSRHLFFMHGGLLWNDWWTTAGWQGPAPLPGSPDAGSPLAAVADTSHNIYLFFVQKGRLSYDLFTSGGSWSYQAQLPTSVDSGTGLAAVAQVGPGAEVYAVSDGALVYDYYDSYSQVWKQLPVAFPG